MTGKGERKTAGSGAENRFSRRRERLGQKALEAVKERLPGRVGIALLGRNLPRQGQGCLTWNAHLAANQPIDMGRKRRGGGCFEGRVRAQGDGEKRLVLVAKIHQR